MGTLIQMILEQMQQKNNYYKETIRGLLFALVMQITSRNNEPSPRLEKEDGSKYWQHWSISAITTGKISVLVS